MRDGVSPVWTTSVSTGGASSASRDRIALDAPEAEWQDVGLRVARD